MTDLADGIAGSKVVVEDEVGSSGTVGCKELLSSDGFGVDAQQLVHELGLKRLAVAVGSPNPQDDRHLEQPAM